VREPSERLQSGFKILQKISFPFAESGLIKGLRAMEAKKKPKPLLLVLVLSLSKDDPARAMLFASPPKHEV
jgi:hypothetical protein